MDHHTKTLPTPPSSDGRPLLQHDTIRTTSYTASTQIDEEIESNHNREYNNGSTANGMIHRNNVHHVPTPTTSTNSINFIHNQHHHHNHPEPPAPPPTNNNNKRPNNLYKPLHPPVWNRLNVTLFIAYTLSVAAVSIPITLVPIIATDISQIPTSSSYYTVDESETSFASKMASSAVLGMSLGKFLHGQAGDVFGARRIASLYSLFVSCSLLVLSYSYTPRWILMSGASVEFFQAVQWPCLTILLSGHYGSSSSNPSSSSTHSRTQEIYYENGIYVISLASRMGALISMPLCSLLLRHTNCHWRVMARAGAALAMLSGMVHWLYTSDNPQKLNAPLNPPPPPLHTLPSSSSSSRVRLGGGMVSKRNNICRQFIGTITGVLNTIVIPSLRAVLGSGVFWTVAMGHTGGCIIRSSERLLGTFFENTSNGTISRLQSGGYSVILSIGIVFGMNYWGKQFTNLSNDGRRRTKLVWNLYGLAVAMCLVLVCVSLPVVRGWCGVGLVWVVESCACFLLGGSLSVQYYHIPGIVAGTFHKNKGMYASYTDGVSYGLSALFWRKVGPIIEQGNPQEYGWAYCWVFVSLSVLLSGSIMIYFMKSFFASKHHHPHSNHIHPATQDDSKRELDYAIASSYYPTYKSETVVAEEHDLLLFESETEGDASSCGSSSFEDDNMMNPLDSSSPFDTRSWNNNHQSSSSPSLGQVELTPRNPIPSTLEQQEQLKQRLNACLEHEENQTCCDCSNPLPRWASIIVPAMPNTLQIACLICQDCVSFHRKLGVHILFVRSVDHDLWTERDVQSLERGGNGPVNACYEGLGVSDKGSNRESFIRNKYERRLWYTPPTGAKKHRLGMSVSKMEKPNLLEGVGVMEDHSNSRSIELVRNSSSAADSYPSFWKGSEGQSLPLVQMSNTTVLTNTELEIRKEDVSSAAFDSHPQQRFESSQSKAGAASMHSNRVSYKPATTTFATQQTTRMGGYNTNHELELERVKAINPFIPTATTTGLNNVNMEHNEFDEDAIL